jgi:hypothetical protein
MPWRPYPTSARPLEAFCATHGDMRSLWTSALSASPSSFPPTLAIACSAKQLLSSLWSSKSFLMLLTTRCSSSCSSCRNRVTARYPICFSEYLVAEMRFTASRCPKSTFQPSMYMYRSCEGQQRGRESGEWRVYLADVFLLLIAIQAGIWGEFC